MKKEKNDTLVNKTDLCSICDTLLKETILGEKFNYGIEVKCLKCNKTGAKPVTISELIFLRNFSKIKLKQCDFHLKKAEKNPNVTIEIPNASFFCLGCKKYFFSKSEEFLPGHKLVEIYKMKFINFNDWPKLEKLNLGYSPQPNPHSLPSSSPTKGLSKGTTDIAIGTERKKKTKRKVLWIE